MSLQLISIPGCSNNKDTASKWPSLAARSNGVKLNNYCQFQKWIKKVNFIKKKNIKLYKNILIQMFLQLTSVPSIFNNNEIISVLPLIAAAIKSVQFKF